MKFKMWSKALAAIALGSVIGAANASLIWGDSAGSNNIDAFDSVTGAPVHHFTPGTGNGRGVVVVGNIVYYTVSGDPHIYKLDATTGAAMKRPRKDIAKQENIRAWFIAVASVRQDQ